MTLQKFLALQEKLSKVSPEKKAHLISYLSQNSQQKLGDPLFPKSSLKVEMRADKIVRRVDVSHFKRYLDALSPEMREFYLKAFPKYKQVELTPSDATYHEYKAPSFSKQVLTQLFQGLDGFPPPTFLPPHPIVEVLADKGIPLFELITYLGLIDVAIEVKKIISKSTLKKLQSCFDQKQIAFLNLYAKKENIPSLLPMNLSNFSGEKDLLHKLIQERGLYRFAQGIKDAPTEYEFFFYYFLPKTVGDQLFSILRKKSKYAITYKGWEEDTITTWRFLCTYSP
ncbi:hypothetical protein K0U07_00505 [bacterium]|nr:hypothetical protein [bacterium]